MSIERYIYSLSNVFQKLEEQKSMQAKPKVN